MACCAAMTHRGRRPRFDRERLRLMLSEAYDPPFIGYLRHTPDNILHVKPEADPKGPIRMWEQPKMGRSYVIGAHGGIEFSSAYVLDRRSMDVCAEWHGRRIDQDRFAEEVVRLAKTYGTALVGTEDDDNPTYQALLRLGHTRLYKHEVNFVKAAWIAAAVDDLSATIREGFSCPSRELVEEMLNTTVKDDGKVALQGKSRVVAAAVALRVNATSGLQSIYPALLKRRAP
jgi:hypothetical protein